MITNGDEKMQIINTFHDRLIVGGHIGKNGLSLKLEQISLEKHDERYCSVLKNLSFM